MIGLWTTPRGPMKVRFVEKNDFGVLDHYVNPAGSTEWSGSEIIFTLFRLPDMSEEQFAEDVGMVERDLKALKIVLES
jgi:hypothetical protein